MVTTERQHRQQHSYTGDSATAWHQARAGRENTGERYGQGRQPDCRAAEQNFTAGNARAQRVPSRHSSMLTSDLHGQCWMYGWEALGG